ncbi:MAG: FtsX-like permease family protein [Deltaproteobacteria bacterium]|nr:FtsX-like permease family protein [Deltaproteobacteria bacterium]MCW9049117.1 FtsX-like permease family protein [Deltaproteobacteria bacterium]
MNSGPVIAQAIRLLRREMRNGLRGFGVFLTCLFLGVFSISAIGNFTAAARSGLLKDASALLGGDLEIRQVHRPVTAEQDAFLQQRSIVSATLEMRTMATAESSGKRGLIELKAVDSRYPLYGQLKLKNGQALTTALASQGESFGAVVEAAFLERFSSAVGETIQVGKARFQINAVIENEPDRSVRAFNLGPRFMVSRRALESTGLIQPGSLINYAYRLKLADQTQAEELKRELQENFPEAGWRLRSWREAAPRVRFFLDRMGTNLTLLGLCSLLVGGLGVTGAVRGYLSGKLDHIATMKSLGATRKVIFATYLLQILLLGFIGSGLGLIAGALLPWLLNLFLGQKFPIPLEPGFFPQVWLVTALFGLLTALLFSLRELGVACLVSPAMLFRGYTEAENKNPGTKIWLMIIIAAVALIAIALLSSSDQRLAYWFIIGAGLCFTLFRLLAWAVIKLVQKLPRPAQPTLRLALANICRPGSPAAGIIFSLGVGLTALIMIVQVQSNLDEMVTKGLPADAPAYFFFDIQPDQLEPVKALVKSNREVTKFNSSPTLRGRITKIAGIAVEQAQISPSVRWAVRGDRFLSYAGQMPDNTELVAGEWWPENYQGPPLISLTADLAKGFGVTIGDSLSVNILGRTITAEIANLRQVDWSTLELNFALVFAPGVLESAPQTHIAAAHLPQDAEEAFYRQITESFANVSAVSVREILANVSRTLTRIGWAFKGMAAVALFTGFLVLTGAISADQHRRIKDAVIFKVCGATRGKILKTFAAEFIFLGLIAGSLSLVAGSLAAFAILEGPLDADYRLHPLLIITTLLAGILMTLALGLLGTWKALGHKPATYLRQE